MTPDTNLGLIFFTGLTTGGLSCLALQGGLLMSAMGTEEKKVKKVLFFLLAKLGAYVLLGAMLGFLGSVISLSPITRGIMQILIGVYLVGIAGAMLELHPFFRYFMIKPPKFLARLVKKQANSENIFAPVVLGAMTVLLPCATTQAMELVAIGSGNPVYGALIMGTFVLGTSPTFYLIGYVFSKASDWFKNMFNKVAAVLMVMLAIMTINSGVALTGSIYTLENFWKVAVTPTSAVEEGTIQGVITNGKQEVVINVGPTGYIPSKITIKNNVPTVIRLITTGTAGCARAFTIPTLGIQKILPVSGEERIEFTPSKTGALVFSCSMGMYTGIINVI